MKWTMVPSPGEEMHAITYGGGKFVAVGKTGQVAVSEDGASWNQVAQIGATLNDVAYGMGRYLAVAQEGSLFTSTDGINWAESRPPGSNIWVGAHGAADRLIAVGGTRGQFPMALSPAILTTLRGAEGWTDQKFELRPFSAAVSSPVGYLVIGSTYLFGPSTVFSADGEDWSETSSVFGPVHWHDIVYGKGVFITVGGCACGPREHIAGPRRFLRGTGMFSPHGQTWTYYGTTYDLIAKPEEEGKLYSVAYGRDIFVSVGNWTSISSTGTNWTHTPTADVGRSIAYGVGRFVIAAQTNFYYSGDLIAPVQIGSARLAGANELSFQIESEPGTVLSIQRSVILGRWRNSLTITNETGLTNITLEMSQTNSRAGFYRAAVLWP